MSTFSKLRVGPKPASAGVPTLIAKISFDPTAASAGTGYILPKGAVITGVTSFGGATGGVAPTVDVGITAGGVEIADELAADIAGTAGTLGTAGYTALAANTEVFAGVGASAATGGTTTIVISYFLEDSRNGANG